jgi:hypothetical protein
MMVIQLTIPEGNLSMMQSLISTFRSNPKFSIIYKYKLIILAVFLFILYFSNFAYVTSQDAVPATLLPWAILNDHNVVLDSFTGFILIQWEPPHAPGSFFTLNLPYFVVLEKGHIVGTTPIVTPILALPFYAPVYFTSLLLGHNPVDFSDSFIFMTDYTMKAAAMTMAVLSVVVLYFLLKRIFDERWAFILSLVYGVCTSTWTISSQSLWQHGTAELLLVCCYYLLFRNIDQRKNIYMLGIGALSALIIFNRPPDAILLIPVVYYCLKEKYWQALPSFIIVGLPFLIYNVYYFNSLVGGYNSALNPAIYTVTSGVLTSTTGSSSAGSFGIINYIWSIVWHFINFNALLLMYTPIAILAIFGIIKVLRPGNTKVNYRTVHLVCILSLLLYTIFYGVYSYSSGWGYGPRFWTDALPLITIFIGWSKYESSLYKAIFVSLAVISFVIQAYGAYVFLKMP